MKTISLLTTVLTLSACGPVDMLATQCGGDGEAICRFFFGHAPDKDTNNDEDIIKLKDEIANLTNGINHLHQIVGGQSEEINQLQSALNTLTVQLVEVETRFYVVGFVDPCGDGPGYDEIIIQMSNGDYVAYFEQSGKRFLTILPINVNLKTTDQQKCKFKIASDNTIVEL